MPDATGREPSESRDRRLAIVAFSAVAVFIALLLIVPPFSVGFDEAKYLGIGASIWAGKGPVSAFGTLFLLHSPLWMTVLFAPQAVVGFDAVSWGHILNGLAGAVVVALTVVMGRRVSPVAGVVAAFAILGFSYLLLLTRTTRLDVPEAALALLYLEIGWRAARTGSIRWAIAAGATFAIAVLVKEVALPLAPAPIVCGVLAGVRWRTVLRTAGWIALAGSIGLAPWFLYYAAWTGRVYRVESAAWTLPLLFAPVLALIVLGLASHRLAASRAVGERLSRARSRLPARLVEHGRALTGWGAAIAWSALFLFFFSRIARLNGGPIYQLSQWKLYLGQWKLDLVPIGLFVVTGLVLALVMLWRDRDAGEHRGVVNALVATICGAPLVIMVVQVGEPPRNYIAQVATAAVVAAGGWSWAAGRLAGWLLSGRRPGVGRWLVTAMVALAVIVGSASVVGRAYLTRRGSAGQSARAVSTVVGWIHANVPTGTPIAFGSFLGYEMAYGLVGDYQPQRIKQQNVIVDPSMPEAFRIAGQPAASDWVAVDTFPRNINEYQAFRAPWVEAPIKAWGIAYWVYTTGSATSAAAILPQLTPEHGFQLVAHWQFGSDVVHIFKVDAQRVALDTTRLYLTPAALARLVARLELTPADSKVTATTLLGVLQVIDPTPASDASLARLRALAGS